MKPTAGLIAYVVIKLGLVLGAIGLFLIWPDKPAILKVEGNRAPQVAIEVTLEGPHGKFVRRMDAGGRRDSYWPVPLDRWDAVSIRCAGESVPHRFEKPGGKSTLIVIGTYGCADVWVRTSTYP